MFKLFTLPSNTSIVYDHFVFFSIMQSWWNFISPVKNNDLVGSFFQAKKTKRRLKGAVRFNVLIHGNDTQKQASSTLSCIHAWSYIQSEIRARRHHMVTEGRLKQKKIENQLKLEAKLHELEVLTTVTYLALERSLHNLLNDRTMLPNLAKSLLSLLVN